MEDLSFYLGRAYYNYVVYLQNLLRRFKLQDVLQPGMGAILFFLFETDDCIIKDLAERLELAPSTLTALLRRMEKAKVITCRRCAEDGRAVRVKLTARGRGLEPRCRELSAALNVQMVRGFGAGEVQALKQSLAQVVKNIRAGIEHTP